MRHLVFWLFLATPFTAAFATQWTFSEPISITAQPQTKVFHHLDSSGRHNIAAGSQGVAIAWEDDRDGTPRVYMAYKVFGKDQGFSELRISGSGEAYEPSIVALDNERFVIAWEEDERIRLRQVQIGDAPSPGPILDLDGQGTQSSLVADNNQLILLWTARDGRFGRIMMQRLAADGLVLRPGVACPVDASPPTDEQLYAAGVMLQDRLVVAWEDRRPKHTIIMAATETGPESCRFSEPMRISEKPEQRNLPYGTGHGVARVAVGRVDEGHAFAAWADKRDFRNGYDIWGAFYTTREGRFGANQMVQDDFGELSKQRHTTVAGLGDGTLVVAWDDDRDGGSDLMLSWYEDDGWSDDRPLSVASGTGQQSNPSIVFDNKGNLHVAWVERDKAGGPTRLKYSMGRQGEQW